MKLTVEYTDKQPTAPSDVECWRVLDRLAEQVAEGKDIYLVTGSELLLSMTRLLVVRKIIDHKDIVYKYKGYEIPIDNDGRIETWPPGFCDNYERVLEELFKV